MMRDDCLQLDRDDALASLRQAFVLPPGVIYLDGNSLGALPRATAARVSQVIEQQWGVGLIRSWNDAHWIDLPQRIGDKIGKLIGANDGETICADSTSINLFKVLAVALKMNASGKRRVILSEEHNFPTDLYMAQGLAKLIGDVELRLVRSDQLIDAIGDDTAVLMLTHVDYRNGAMHDMAILTARAHEAGAVAIWDLAHSAGAVPVKLNACEADFAVGCGYKYLNGGPGAPAFLWVAQRHHAAFEQPLSGWLGHSAPFEFSPEYRPADGVGRYLAGTPAIISMAALEVGVDGVRAAGIDALRAKSLALSSLFIRLVEQGAADLGLRLVTPRAEAERGSQVCFAHRAAYAVMQALIARGVIGDFRAPDILRFGFTPMYIGYTDAWDAAATLLDILRDGSWDQPRFHQRAKVT